MDILASVTPATTVSEPRRRIGDPAAEPLSTPTDRRPNEVDAVEALNSSIADAFALGVGTTSSRFEARRVVGEAAPGRGRSRGA